MSSCAVIDCISIESTIHENFDAIDKHVFLSREVNQRLLKLWQITNYVYIAYAIFN